MESKLLKVDDVELGAIVQCHFQHGAEFVELIQQGLSTDLLGRSHQIANHQIDPVRIDLDTMHPADGFALLQELHFIGERITVFQKQRDFAFAQFQRAQLALARVWLFRLHQLVPPA